MSLFKKLQEFFSFKMNIGEGSPVREWPMVTEDRMFELAILHANNFGAPKDMYHMDYGQIMKDGHITKEGVRFFEDFKELYEKQKREQNGTNASTSET